MRIDQTQGQRSISRSRARAWAETLLVFGGFAFLLWVTTDFAIPLVSTALSIEPVVAWFMTGTVLVLSPILLVALVILSHEPRSGFPLAKRLRFRRLNSGDFLWAIAALFVIAAATLSIQWVLGYLTGDSSSQPAFMNFEPLTPGRYWILGAWVPFWLLNVAAEEILWRGVLLPRQEMALGGAAWFANAVGWLLFHSAFGWRVVAVLVPIAVILPYVAQRRKNTALGVLLHAILNGSAFVAVAFGYA